MSENNNTNSKPPIGVLLVLIIIGAYFYVSLETDVDTFREDPESYFEAAMDCFSTQKPKEIKKGFRLLVHAAVRGHVEAQFMLGYHFVNGIGVPRDLEEGRYWLQLAASQGHLKAREILQQMSLQYPMYYP